MAKARRTIRQEHEDGSATIDLNQPAPDKPLESAEPRLPDYGSVEAKEAVEKAPPKAHRTQREPVDDGPSLEDQIRTLKKAEESAKKRVDEERAARVQAEQQRIHEVNRAQYEITRSHHDLVTNTLEGQQAALTLAKQEYAAARASNDPGAEADALDKMQKINARISTLESGREELERRVQNPPRVQQPASGPQNIEGILAQMPALTNEERDWIRNHPDSVTDQKQIARMQVAYQDAQDRGIRRNSSEYFKFFEDRLGYEPSEDINPEEEYEEVDRDDPPPQQRKQPQRTLNYSAPVSRTSPGASSRESPNSGRVTLSKEEREAARISGIDERTYAEGKRRLEQLKKKGYYQEVG